ncbi:MAG: DUF2232 domain-containing protein [Bacillota bacterium]
MNYKNIIIGTLILTAVILLGIFFPLLFIMLPIVLINLDNKLSFNEIFISFIITLMIVYLIFQMVPIIILVFSYGILNSIALKYVYDNKKDPFSSQGILSGTTLLSFIIFFLSLSVFYNIDITNMFAQSIDGGQSLIENEQFLQSMNIDFENVVNQMQEIIPFILVFISVMNASIIYFLNRYIYKRMDKEVIKINPFKNFSLPRHFIYGMSFILVLSYISSKLMIVDFDSISINVILIIIYLFSIQGAALLFYWLDRFNTNKILKGIILFVLIIFQGMFLLAIAGWLDMIFNFRKNKSE